MSVRYLHGPAVDQVLAQDDLHGNVQWMLADHLGTIHDLINSTGQVVNHLKYDAFGNLITQSNSAVQTRYHFTGREFDSETGLQYNRARYYDMALGRFLSEDPIGFAASEVNLYRYVRNRPNISRDPLGTYDEEDARFDDLTGNNRETPTTEQVLADHERKVDAQNKANAAPNGSSGGCEARPQRSIADVAREISAKRQKLIDKLLDRQRKLKDENKRAIKDLFFHEDHPYLSRLYDKLPGKPVRPIWDIAHDMRVNDARISRAILD